MRTLGKSTVLAVAFLTGAAIAAKADPEYRATATAAATITSGASGSEPFDSSRFPNRQVAALPPYNASSLTPNSVILPEITVYPHHGNVGPRASSFSTARTEHYRPPSDFAANIALHPHTSGAGSRASSHRTVREEHYKVPPDYDQNAVMHPYTSSITGCAVGSHAPCQAPSSHHNR
jgi:hypothetical protein